MATMVMSRGDLLPALTATLTAQGAAVDLSTATEIKAKGVQNGSLVIDRVVTGNALGEISMSWQAGDTDDVGYIHFTFVVTWPSNQQQTFPEEGDVRVRVAL